MKRILIIEATRMTADNIAEAIEGLGEIEICTTKTTTGRMHDARMPAKKTIIAKIKDSDIIFLAYELYYAPYWGDEFLEYCNGKTVIQIEDIQSNHYMKLSNNLCRCASGMNPSARERIRSQLISLM